MAKKIFLIFFLSHCLFFKTHLAAKWMERLYCSSWQSTFHFFETSKLQEFLKTFRIWPFWLISTLSNVRHRKQVTCNLREGACLRGLPHLLLPIPNSHSPALQVRKPQLAPAAPALHGEQPSFPSRSRAAGQAVPGEPRSFSAHKGRR